MSLKLIINMVNTRNNVFLLHHLDSFDDHVLVAVVDLSCQFLGPQGLEVPLDVAEDELDRIESRFVRHVVDPPDVVVSHCLLGPV